MRLLSGLLSGQAFSSTPEGGLWSETHTKSDWSFATYGENIRAPGAKGTPPVCIEAASKQF